MKMNRRHEDKLTERAFFVMKWAPVLIALTVWVIAALELAI